MNIRYAEFPRDLAEVRGLFREYADALGVDLCFQDFEGELFSLPGKYAAPSGRLLLAWQDVEAVGCVALRAVNATSCEMKRLYVRPHVRRVSVGRMLAERICDEARAAGYTRICLDTLPSMVAAQALYESLGFKPIEQYVFNPVVGTRYLALDL